MQQYHRTGTTARRWRLLGLAVPSVAALVWLILIASSAYAYSPDENDGRPSKTEDCGLRDYLVEMLPIYREFSDAVMRASSVPAGALGGEVAIMQQARDRVAQLERPACARDPAQLLEQAMDDTIMGFTWFDAGDSDTAHGYLARGWDEHRAYEAELSALIDRETQRTQPVRTRDGKPCE